MPKTILVPCTPTVKAFDTKAAPFALERAAEKYDTLTAFSGDAGYRGTAVSFVENTLGLELHISTKIKDTFAILPKRWIVERTFAWLGTTGDSQKTLKSSSPPLKT